jgi:hypothetical protein
MVPRRHAGAAWNFRAGWLCQSRVDLLSPPLSEKAVLVWSAQGLSVTKALVFGLAPEIPATNAIAIKAV